MFGIYSYLKDYNVEHFSRDPRAHRMLEGANEVMHLDIGRNILQ